MPTTLTIGFFVFGAVLLLIGLVGGKFNIFVSYMPGVSNPFLRIIAFILGVVFLLLAIYPYMVSIVSAQSGNTSLPAESGMVTLVPQLTAPAPQPNQTNLPSLATATPLPRKPNPAEFVISYWQNVSDGRYETAWLQLSPKFQQSAHNNDYNKYVYGYQQMNLCRIVVSNVNLIQQDNSSAVVTAHLTYYTGTQCTASAYNFEMWLVYDTDTTSWLFDRNAIE